MFCSSAGAGSVEVVAGCMYSGKSEELIRRLVRARIARLKVLAIKPKIDTRYDAHAISSHDGSKIEAVTVTSADEIFDLCRDVDVVGIDEAQFLEGLPDVVHDLATAGKRVIVAGLDLDFRGKPFGPVPTLMATADLVDKLHAVCVVCGASATRSQRIAASDQQVLVGSDGVYEARCRQHWSPLPTFSEARMAEQED